MGLNDLWERLVSEWEPVHINELQGKSLAIDGQVWLLECSDEASRSRSSLLSEFFSRCQKLIDAGIQPFILFDRYENQHSLKYCAPEKGADKTYERDCRPIKIDENARGRYSRADITPSAFSKILQLLDCMGVRYFKSDTADNEAAGAYLEEIGKVQGFISPRMEYFLYGGANLYRVKFDKCEDILSVALLRAQKLFESLGLNRARLVGLAMLLGCEYCEKGITGIGLVTALEIMAEFSLTPDDHPLTLLDRFRSYCTCELTTRRTDSSTKVKLRRSNFAFPQGFPNTDKFVSAVNAFMWPCLGSIPFQDRALTPTNTHKVKELLGECESRRGSSTQGSTASGIGSEREVFNGLKKGRTRKRRILEHSPDETAKASRQWSKRELAAILTLQKAGQMNLADETTVRQVDYSPTKRPNHAL